MNESVKLQNGSKTNKENITLLVTERLSKQFGHALALKEVDFSLNRGEVHALVGENGAGKSTLAKILAGTITSDHGRVILDGHPVNFSSPIDAIKSGVAEVYQSPMVIKSLPIWVNIFLGRERTKRGFLPIQSLKAEAKNLMAQMECDFDPNRRLSTLSPAEVQMVAIAKALNGQVKILILDEPTVSLTATEAERLFNIIDMLKQKDVGIIYITHRLKEIPRIADRVTVLRDGRHVATVDAKSVSEENLIKLMTGKEVNLSRRENGPSLLGETVLICKNLSCSTFNNLSFEIRKGDILGFGGLVGSGKEDINKMIFGLGRLSSGEVFIDGKKTTPNPSSMLKKGIMYFPPDRHSMGLVMNQSMTNNLTLSSLKNFLNKLRLLNLRRQLEVAKQIIKTLDIRPQHPKRVVKTFSGGNQQKIMLGRALTRPVKILLLDEPTRGVDVGAREKIYDYIRRMARDGAAVIAVTSDMQELLALPNKIAVMSRGVCTPMMDAEDLNEEKLLALSFSGHRSHS